MQVLLCVLFFCFFVFSFVLESPLTRLSSVSESHPTIHSSSAEGDPTRQSTSHLLHCCHGLFFFSFIIVIVIVAL